MPRSLVPPRHPLAVRPSCCPAPLVGLPVSPDEPVACEVEGQGHQEQCRPHREYGLIGYRTAGRLSAHHLYDVRCHRLHTFERTSEPVRLGAHRDGHYHRLPDGARDSQDHGRRDPRERRRHNDLRRRLALGRAERVGAFPERERHRVDGVLADRGNRRDDHYAHNESGGDRVEGLYAREEAVPEERGNERQREVSVDHRWHAGQDLQRWLEPPPQTLWGVLAEEDSREQSYGKRHGYSDDGRHQRAVDERQYSEVALRRRPPRRSQKLHRGHLQEEPRGLLAAHDDDADRREYGQVCAGREKDLYDALSGLPGTAVALPGSSPGPRPFRSDDQRKPSESSWSERGEPASKPVPLCYKQTRPGTNGH